MCEMARRAMVRGRYENRHTDTDIDMKIKL